MRDRSLWHDLGLTGLSQGSQNIGEECNASGAMGLIICCSRGCDGNEPAGKERRSAAMSCAVSDVEQK